MYLSLLILSLILVAVVILSLALKMIFDPEAEFSAHSCAIQDGILDKDSACYKCQLKDLSDCPEKKYEKIGSDKKNTKLKIQNNETNKSIYKI